MGAAATEGDEGRARHLDGGNVAKGDGPANANGAAAEGGVPSALMNDEELKQQILAAQAGQLSKEEEEERSNRNKDLLGTEKSLAEMSIEERWEFARNYKEAGNVFFKEKRYEFALKNYQETVTYLRHGIRMGETDRDSMPMGAPSGEADPEAKAIMASCYSNMAACALKLSRFEEVVKHASTALDAGAKGIATDVAKAKILFRRGKAYDALGEVEKAYQDILKAKTYEPKDKAIQAYFVDVLRKYKRLKLQEHEAAKSLWQGKLVQEEDQGSADKDIASSPIPGPKLRMQLLPRIIVFLGNIINAILGPFRGKRKNK